MRGPVNIGLLGLGSIGATHAKALAELRDLATVRAFTGGNGERAAEAGWPEAVQTGPEELVADAETELVAICSPSEHHAGHAIAALEAGKHIVVEKPLALTVSDADRIVGLAERNNRMAAVISQRRFEPEYAAVKGMLQNGALGHVRLAQTHVHWWRDADYYRAAPWRSSMVAGGGSLMNQGVHNVDLLQWLVGPVTEVTAQYATLGHDIEAEDTTVATLRFANGALGQISTSTATPPGSPATVALHMDTGVIELGQGQILRWDVEGTPPPRTTSYAATGAADPAAIGIRGHIAQWEDMLKALSAGSPPTIPAAQGASVVRLICGIYRAAETGSSIRLEELS